MTKSKSKSGFSHSRVFLIPLDARPVCYDLPQRLAASAGLRLGLPSPKLLGQLKTPADEQRLFRWIKNHLFENEPVIVALDTIAYGGLIASRIEDEPLQRIESRLDKFYELVHAEQLLGFSAILRIPNYNNAEEEPDYWHTYGTQLYQYSWASHQNPEKAKTLSTKIPEAVLQDFLNRRQRHLKINQSHLQRLYRGDLDYLAFCQDDTGAYGLNVQEAETLNTLITQKKCQDRSHVQTGADEVASCMLARLISQWHETSNGNKLTMYPVYSAPDGEKIIAKFDGIAIQKITERAIVTCGATVAESVEQADILVLVHTPQHIQGDHCEPPNADASIVQPEQVQTIISQLKTAQGKHKPVILADVAYANGSDPLLSERLLAEFSDLNFLYGYAGWNTPGNTIGTAVSMGVVRLLAERHQCFNADAFAQLLMIRLGDDWLYQSQVRKRLKKSLETRLLNVEMANGLALIKNRLGLSHLSTQCKLPCNRPFEVEILLT